MSRVYVGTLDPNITKEQLEDEALASVDGFGNKRLARYGSTLLDVLRAADAA